MVTKVNAEYLKEQYDILYGTMDVHHPKLGKMPPYGNPSARDPRLLNIVKGLYPEPRGVRVLDASTGRGHLLRMLLKEKYDAHGTDVAAPLFEEGGDLAGLPATMVDYASIHQAFESKSFDVVISNDVLEHLVGIGEVEDAFRNLASLCRGWLVVSVGLKYAKKYATACNLEVECLHRVRRPPGWWEEKFRVVAHLKNGFSTNVNWWGYGKVK